MRSSLPFGSMTEMEGGLVSMLSSELGEICSPDMMSLLELKSEPWLVSWLVLLCIVRVRQPTRCIVSIIYI